MRRPALLTCAAMLVVTGCTGDGGQADAPTVATAGAAAPTGPPGTAPAAAAPTPPLTPGPAPVAMTQEADGVRRFGDGRALLASYDPVADRTVVATTIGLVATTGDGPPATLTPEMATLLATSGDGRLAAVTTSAGHLLVVDVTTGQATSFDVPVDRFSSLAFVGDDVIAASPTEVVRFDTGGATQPLLAAPDGSSLGPAAVAPTGDLAVPILTSTPVLATWSPAGERTDVDLGLAAGSRLTGVTWSDDGAQLAVLHAPPGAGDAMGIWDVAAGRFTGQVALPNLVAPHQVAFPTPDRVVLPVVDDVVAFDLAGQAVASFSAGSSAIASIDASGGAVVVAGLDGTLARWVVGTAPTELAPRTVTLVDHRGGPAVSVVDQVGRVRTFAADGTPTRDLDHWAVGEATGVDIGADGAIVLATSTGAVRLLGPAGDAVTAMFDRPQGDVSDVTLAPGEDRLATGVSVQKAAEAWDDTIEVNELPSGTSDFRLGGEAENVTGCSFYEANVVFSPDGSLLASSSHDFTVQISPLADPGATTVLEPHVGSVLDIEFSPDGATLLTSADDGTLRMWDVDGWQLRAEVTSASPGGWYSLAYAPDGSFVAASDAAGEILLLDPATGDVTRSLDGVRASLGDMVVTPDGGSLVAPEPDGRVGIWSLGSGRIERHLQGHTLPVDAIAVSADGAMVATASQDGTVRTWPLPTA